MSAANNVTLTGNLGKDPQSNEKKTVVSFSLATSAREKNKEGEWVERTEWHNVICFGRLGENVEKFLSKGSNVSVQGRIRSREYTNKDDQKVRTTEIIAEDIKFNSTKKKDNPAEAADTSKGGDDLPF